MSEKPPQPFNRDRYLRERDTQKKSKSVRPQASANTAKLHPASEAASFRKDASKKNHIHSSHDPRRDTVKRLQHYTGLVDRLSQWLVPANTIDAPTPETLARPMLVRGMFLCVVVFGTIMLFAAIMPMATGAVASGRLVVDSNRKDIQHLEGGIVQEILVKEGARVKEGEVLVRLDPTSADARQNLIYGQWVAAKATEARLLAERDGDEAITFPQVLLEQAQKDADIAAALDAQERLFISRRDALQGQLSVLDQKIAQSGDEISGLAQQASSASSQISLLNEEIQTVRSLLSSGNAVRPRLLALERQQAALIGQRGQAQSMISRVKQTIGEAKIEKINVKNDFMNKVVAELKETQVQLGTLEEQQRTSDDIAKRIEITSPIDGQVTGLRIFTKGGVIRPGDTIMSIVPTGDKLTVEARVSPFDIEVVHQGLKAQVRFSGLSARKFRPVEGEVVTVSADRFDDEATGQAFYIARIEIPASQLDYLKDVTLSPGMPVDTLIVTGSRTMLSYLFRPIGDSFGKAFRQE